MAIPGYRDYRRREYCRAVECPVQKLLDKCKQGSEEYEEVRALCKHECIHTTYEFHHWLIENGFEVVKKEK